MGDNFLFFSFFSISNWVNILSGKTFTGGMKKIKKNQGKINPKANLEHFPSMHFTIDAN